MIQAPCLCRGSLGRVHISCIRKWLGMRYGLEERGGNGQYFSVKPPCCDVCKNEFPVMVSIGAKKVSLLPGLPKVATPFLVLSIPRRRGEDSSRPHGERFIFAPSESGAVLKIGRGRDSQLRVDDVSVSRVHANVTLVDGAFVLKDNNAKFQTVIRPTKPQVLSQAEPLSLQMGRTVLSMALLRPEGSEDEPGQPGTSEDLHAALTSGGTTQSGQAGRFVSTARWMWDDAWFSSLRWSYDRCCEDTILELARSAEVNRPVNMVLMRSGGEQGQEEMRFADVPSAIAALKLVITEDEVLGRSA